MSGEVAHWLVGYDRRTERMDFTARVPEEYWPAVRLIMHIDPRDTDTAGAYPLSAAQACEIARLWGLKIDTDRFGFFLEAFADAESPAEEHSDRRMRA